MFQKFLGLFLGGLGLCAAGLFIYLGHVEEIKEEVSWWKEAGLTMAITGAVFVLTFLSDAFAPRSRLTHFLKGTLGGGSFAILGGLVLYGVAMPTYDAWQLSDHGRVQVVEVIDVRHVPKIGKYGTAKDIAKIRVDGRNHEISPWHGSRSATSARVIYLPEDPSVLRIYSDDDGLIEHLEDAPGYWFLGLGTPLGLCAFLYGLYAMFLGISGKGRKEFLEPD
ncbi:MAG: hypothetical protein AAF196_07520 [Planctomycetota bacterium]